MIVDMLALLPLCVVTALVYQTTRSDDLSTLAGRTARTFLLWTGGMVAIGVVSLALSLAW